MRKIISRNQSGIFEKLVQDRNGWLFRVRFVVVERDGVLRGKVISCEAVCGLHLDRTLTPRGRILHFLRRVCRRREGFYLPVRKALQAIKDKGLKIKDFFVSPYFNKFDFLTVIKIRAPALRVI